MHRYVDTKTLERFKDIYSSAFSKWKAYKDSLPKPVYRRFTRADNSEMDVLTFEKYITLEIIDEKIKILDAIGKREIPEKEVFKRRVDIMANLKTEKDEVQNELTHQPERAFATKKQDSKMEEHK
ncbi:hypothetical protein [Pedobacter sp. NJ-S-72]